MGISDQRIIIVRRCRRRRQGTHRDRLASSL